MITIRLQRRGRKNDPSFRVIVTDSKKASQSGRYLEMVGSYDPRVDRIELKQERIRHWIEHGAQTSDTVHNLLISQKVIDGKKINVLPKKTVPAREAAAQPAVSTAPAASAVTESEDTSAENTEPATEELAPASAEAAATQDASAEKE